MGKRKTEEIHEQDRHLCTQMNCTVQQLQERKCLLFMKQQTWEHFDRAFILFENGTLPGSDKQDLNLIGTTVLRNIQGLSDREKLELAKLLETGSISFLKTHGYDSMDNWCKTTKLKSNILSKIADYFNHHDLRLSTAKKLTCEDVMEHYKISTKQIDDLCVINQGIPKNKKSWEALTAESLSILNKYLDGNAGELPGTDTKTFSCHYGPPSLLPSILEDFSVVYALGKQTDLIIIDLLNVVEDVKEENLRLFLQALIEKVTFGAFLVLIIHKVDHYHGIQCSLGKLNMGDFQFTTETGIIHWGPDNDGFSFANITGINFAHDATDFRLNDFCLYSKQNKLQEGADLNKDIPSFQMLDQNKKGRPFRNEIDNFFWEAVIATFNNPKLCDVLGVYTGAGLVRTCTQLKRNMACITETEEQTIFSVQFQAMLTRGVPISEPTTQSVPAHMALEGNTTTLDTSSQEVLGGEIETTSHIPSSGCVKSSSRWKTHI